MLSAALPGARSRRALRRRASVQGANTPASSRRAARRRGRRGQSDTCVDPPDRGSPCAFLRGSEPHATIRDYMLSAALPGARSHRALRRRASVQGANTPPRRARPPDVAGGMASRSRARIHLIEDPRCALLGGSEPHATIREYILSALLPRARSSRAVRRRAGVQGANTPASSRRAARRRGRRGQPDTCADLPDRGSPLRFPAGVRALGNHQRLFAFHRPDTPIPPDLDSWREPWGSTTKPAPLRTAVRPGPASQPGFGNQSHPSRALGSRVRHSRRPCSPSVRIALIPRAWQPGSRTCCRIEGRIKG
jgi:hypothetical protein